MATMTVSLPDPMKDWIEAQITRGEYASVSDYVRDLIRRDRARRETELSIDDLRKLVVDAKASGVSNRSVDEIFADAEKVARSRGILNE
jgi:antitoxin ParD1/3/4